MLSKDYDYLPDCVWDCPKGGRRALEHARDHADKNLRDKFPKPPKDINRYGEAFHQRFRQGAAIPHEIRAAGAESCSTCKARILCSAFVVEHYDTRESKAYGSIDTHWGQGNSIEHEYFIVESSQPNCQN